MCVITHFIRAHKLILFFRSEGPFYFVFMSIMFVIIVGSQLFWMSRIGLH